MHWGMAMTETDRETEKRLEALFAQARSEPEEPDAALMVRVLGDAFAEQAAIAVPDDRMTRVRRGWGLWAALGGWPAMGGLATAAVAGLWIGFSPTLGVGDALGTVVGGRTDDVISLVDVSGGFGFDLYEMALAGEEDAG